MYQHKYLCNHGDQETGTDYGKKNNSWRKIVFLTWIVCDCLFSGCTNPGARAAHTQKWPAGKCGVRNCFYHQRYWDFTPQELETAGTCFTLPNILQILPHLGWKYKLPPQVAALTNRKWKRMAHPILRQNGSHPGGTSLHLCLFPSVVSSSSQFTSHPSYLSLCFTH